MITLVVGDVTEYLEQATRQISQDAKLITQSNHNDITDGTYYVSLGDFANSQDFIQTLDKAHTLIYCPPGIWSDQTNSGSMMKFWTEYYLMCYLNQKNVIHNNQLPLMSENKSTMLALVDTRKSQEYQLWVGGCSISHGIGVKKNQRFGQLLSDALNLPVSFLTKGGSSIQWAADQILRSDIRPNDIVVWGLTSFTRLPYYSNGKIHHITPQTYKDNLEFNKIIPLDQLDGDNITYQNLAKIYAVINFCQKIQAKLFLFGILVDHQMLKWTADLPDYRQLHGCFDFMQNLFIDLGSDNTHPGPRMHQWYCDQMLKTIQAHLTS